MKLEVSVATAPIAGGIVADPASLTTERAEQVEITVTGDRGETVCIQITEENGTLHVHTAGDGASRLTLIEGKGDIDKRNGGGAA